jgi:TIGR03009 family protein
MRHAPPGTLLGHVRRLAAAAALDHLTDGQLLRRFSRGREEAAFAALVQRHGPMVWGVCRRIVRHEQDAEDAFQATFLALARHAASIRQGGALAGWLYRVGRRVALKAGQLRARRPTPQRLAPELPCASAPCPVEAREVWAVVEEELHHLPDKYQAPLVLCCLEGRSKAEAARQLGWKEGTVSGRLAEGRKRLRGRLLRRGPTLGAAGAAGTLTPLLAAAAPPKLVSSTVKAALLFTAGGAEAGGLISDNVLVLAKGVSQAMTTKMKIAAVLLLTGSVLVGGAGWLSRGVVAERPVERGAEVTPREPPPKPRPTAPPIPDPEPPPPPAPRDDRLDTVLERWDREMRGLQAVSCQVRRTDLDRVFATTQTREGIFRYLKPDRVLLEMHKNGEPQTWEKLVRDGRFLYWFETRHRVIRKFELAAVQPFLKRIDDNLATVLLGTDARAMKRRYELQLVKEDAYYLYMLITPRTPPDLAEFVRARLVLRKDSFRPRQLWFEEPNGNQTTWDILRIDTGVRLRADDFAVQVPAGWRMEALPK